MIYNFDFKGTNVEVSTDKKNWYVKFTDQDGLINLFKVSYPQPLDEIIRVPYAWQLIRPSNNAVVDSLSDQYFENNMDAYYDALLPAGQTYGSFAAYNAINGLIARLPVFDGNKTLANGYRIFDIATGNFFQPVVFDIINIQEETRDELGNGNADGGFEVQIHSGAAPFEWRIIPDGQAAWPWRSVDRVYANLAAGNYRIEVKDMVGTLRYQDITIPIYDFIAG